MIINERLLTANRRPIRAGPLSTSFTVNADGLSAP